MEIKAEKQKFLTYLNSILKNFKGKHIRARNLIIIVIIIIWVFFCLFFFFNHFECGAVVTDIFSVLHYC